MVPCPSSFVPVKEGQIPFHLAALKNSKECLELLLSHGAEANIQSNVSIYFIYNILYEISNYVTMHRMDGHLFIWLLSVIMKSVWYYCCPMRIRHTLLLYDIMIMLYVIV